MKVRRLLATRHPDGTDPHPRKNDYPATQHLLLDLALRMPFQPRQCCGTQLFVMPWTTRLAEVSHATCLALARPPLGATTASTACRSSFAGQCCSFLSACHLAENFLHDSFLRSYPHHLQRLPRVLDVKFVEPCQQYCP